MSRNNLFKIAILSISIMFIIFGCKKSSSNEPEPDIAKDHLDAAWDKFESGDYTEAIVGFESVIDEFDSYENEANAGIGWCYAYLAKGNGPDDTNFTTAVSFFNLASTITDALAGRCLVNNVLNNYQNSVNDGKAVISADNTYEFEHDSQVDISLIRLVVAESAYYLGNYDEVVAQLDIIDPGITHSAVDPEGLLVRIEALLAG